MGVFQIKNIINSKVLIDYSIDMESKWNRHKMELKFGSHRNRGFQNEWNEYGEENFVFSVLSELKTSEKKTIDYNKELKTLQEMVIEGLNTENIYK